MKKSIVSILVLSNLIISCATENKTSEEKKGQPAVDVEIGSVDKAEEIKQEKNAAWDKREVDVDKRNDALSAAIEKGNGEEIEKQSSSVLAAQPNDMFALNALAMHHFMSGRLGIAKSLIERAFQSHKDSATLHNNLGAILLKEGDLVSAVNSFKAALNKDKKHAQANANYGLILARNHNYEKALPYLSASHSRLKYNKNLSMAYALALRGTSNYSNAEKIYKDVLDKEPENSEALLNYAILMVEYKKDKNEGLKILGKIKFFETNEEKMKLVRDLEDRANQLK